MKRFSDLEMAILGVVFKRAPCTSYVVAREFANSPSSHWSGSAGAVYPAVARLLRLGLLRRERATRLGRPCTLLRLPPAGVDMLRRWLAPPLSEDSASIMHDPVRTRTYFLAALPPDQRRDFLDDAIRQLLAQVPRLHAECEQYRQSGDWFSEQAQRGALIIMKARLAWLEEFRQALGGQPAELSASPPEDRHETLEHSPGRRPRQHGTRRRLGRGTGRRRTSLAD